MKKTLSTSAIFKLEFETTNFWNFYKLPKHSKVANFMIEQQMNLCRARDYKILAGNYKSFAGNSKTTGEFKIMLLVTSNKFQTVVWLSYEYLVRPMPRYIYFLL